LQTGIVTKTLAVNTGRLTGIDRSCAITQIFTDTESSAATDELDFIETVDFVEGDSIRLTQYVSGRVVTVTDAATSAGNIYLTNQSPFNCEDNKSIELRLQYDSTLGLIWIENGRSTNQGYITLSRVEARALATTGAIIIGQTYNVYDVGDDGIILTGITNSLYSFDGEYIAVNPDYQNTSGDFESTWNAILGTATIGKLYAYNGVMWESLTGSIGTAPNTDAVNWQLVPKTDPRYVREIDFVQYDIVSNKVIRRTDKRSNQVSGADAITAFKWGSDQDTGNVINNATNNWMVNNLGQCINNFITGDMNVSPSAYSVDMINSTITAYIDIVPSVGGTISFVTANITVPCIIDLTKIVSDTSSIEVHGSWSNLIVGIEPSSVSGNTLTIPLYAKYASTFVVNSTGSTIRKIDTSLVGRVGIDRKIIAKEETTIIIQPTAKASAVLYNIISDDLTAVTLTNANTPPWPDPSVQDFYIFTAPIPSGSAIFTWQTVNYKVYV
jgi:hypothetical protein